MSAVSRTEKVQSWTWCQVCGWFENKPAQGASETHAEKTGHLVIQQHEVTTWYYQKKESQ